MAQLESKGQELTPGQLFTRRCEGTYSQVKHPHVPGWWLWPSGVTLTYGFDCGAHTSEQVFNMLTGIGVSEHDAEEFALAAGLKGRKAKKWLDNSGLDRFEFTPEQCDAVFLSTYRRMEQRARRLYEKPDCRKVYGWILKWEQVHQKIRDIIVDMTYRGDWVPKTRKWLAAAVRSNTVAIFAVAMASRQYWRVRRGVPKDRFERRAEYLAEKP